MNSPETPHEETKGERWLNMLDLGEYIGTEIPDPRTGGSQMMRIEDFTEICGDHARVVFDRLETVPADHPAREPAIAALREKVLEDYLGIKPETPSA